MMFDVMPPRPTRVFNLDVNAFDLATARYDVTEDDMIRMKATEEDLKMAGGSAVFNKDRPDAATDNWEKRGRYLIETQRARKKVHEANVRNGGWSFATLKKARIITETLLQRVLVDDGQRVHRVKSISNFYNAGIIPRPRALIFIRTSSSTDSAKPWEEDAQLLVKRIIEANPTCKYDQIDV